MSEGEPLPREPLDTVARPKVDLTIEVAMLNPSQTPAAGADPTARTHPSDRSRASPVDGEHRSWNATGWCPAHLARGLTVSGDMVRASLGQYPVLYWDDKGVRGFGR